MIIPLLPLVYYQAKRTRKMVPVLKEPEDISGYVSYDGGVEEMHVLCVGESTMAGLGVSSHKIGLAGTIANELSKLYKRSIKWDVIAKSGFTVSQLRVLISGLDSGLNPDIVVIAVGGNDAFALNSPWRWKAELNKLIHALSQNYPKASVYFLNMPPVADFPALPKLLQIIMGKEMSILGDALEQCVGRFEHVYFNLKLIKLDEWIARFDGKYKQEDFFSDGVHPSPLTYQAWGTEMAHFIKQSLDF